MIPEEKFAHRLLERHNLIPPYDLEELVLHYAELDFLNFPVNADADGVCLNLKQSNKPKIYINSLRPPVRQKFTLAHELGHVIIPWHIGNIIVSHTEINKDELDIKFDSQHYRNGDYEYRQIESEANRFAAELLIPTLWLVNLLSEVDAFNFQEILQEIIHRSGTSKDTTMIKVFKALPPGYICAEIDSNDLVINSFMSAGTQVYKLTVGTHCSYEPYLRHKEKKFFSLDNRKYILWTFDNFIEVPNEIVNSSWREILSKILVDTNLQHKQQSINTILSTLFDRNKEQDDSEIFSRIMHRYSEKKDLPKLIQHPLFEQYVVKRLRELRLKYPPTV